jgi:hypothetical protein
LIISSVGNASGNLLSNKVDSSPISSKTVEIYLVDLSKSVDKDVVLQGINSFREKVANVYGNPKGSYNTPANSYFYWFPIRGVNDRKDFFTLFSNKSDSKIWISVRNYVGGKTNQIKALEKIRTQGGLWYKLINASSLSNSCINAVSSYLATPGLFGSSLTKASYSVCAEAISTRNNFALMQKAVNSYLSGAVTTQGGTDIFGAIGRVDDEVSNKSSFGKFNTINLIFVSDGINNTPSTNLRSKLLGNPDAACSLGQQAASPGLKYSNSKLSVKMYGLGEGRSNSSLNNEILRDPLKKFWECYWSAKGVRQIAFGQLDELGVD